MSYTGSKIEIPLGKYGVRSDDPNADLTPGELYRGMNIDMYQGMIQKSPGCKRWNTLTTKLSSPILNACDWYPSDSFKRPVVACKNGNLYRFKSPYRYDIMTSATGAPATLTVSDQSHFVIGGEQLTNTNRKLFFFSGNDQVQVISGDTLVRRNILKPAIEWTSGNYPSFGIMYRGRLWTMGMPGFPHTIIASTAADQEDFQTTGTGDDVLPNDIYPGEGERIITAWVYRGKFFVAKYPYGIYILNDDATSPTSWYFTRLVTSFGAISPHSAVEVIEDMYIANQYGTITSLMAAFQLGQIKLADITSNLRVEQAVRMETQLQFNKARWTMFYPDKKLALFTYKSAGGTATDTFFCIDYSSQRPKSYFLNFTGQSSVIDKPNCLFIMKDHDKNLRPAFGASDGYIYIMDDVNRGVGLNEYDNTLIPPGLNGSGYISEFRIPYTDFGVETNKLYDELEIEIEHAGLWNLNCDVHIDDSYIETLQFIMSNPPVLRGSPDSQCFQLDSSRLLGRQTRNIRKRLHGRGRNIAFRFYTSANNQNFKVTKLVVYTRIGNEDKKAA